MVRVRFCFLSIWTILDPIYYMFTRLKYIYCENNHRTIFRIRLTRYKGIPLTLADGTIIKKNDLLIKIHLHNVKLMNEMCKIKGETVKGRLIYNKVKEGLPGLAAYVQQHPQFDEIKGIIGITMLNKGCKRLGFETFSIKNKLYCLVKQIVFIPMYLLTSNQYTRNTLKRPPKYLFMTKGDLLSKYFIK